MPGYSGRTPAWTRNHKPRKPFSKERKAHGDTIARGTRGKFGAGTVGFRRRKRWEGIAKLAGLIIATISLILLFQGFGDEVSDFGAREDNDRAQFAESLYRSARNQYLEGNYEIALREVHRSLNFEPDLLTSRQLKLLIMQKACLNMGEYCVAAEELYSLHEREGILTEHSIAFQQTPAEP